MNEMPTEMDKCPRLGREDNGKLVELRQGGVIMSVFRRPLVGHHPY